MRRRVAAGCWSLDAAEKEHIRRCLFICGGNVSEAARRLGIHRRSLQRKLHKHGLDAMADDIRCEAALDG